MLRVALRRDGALRRLRLRADPHADRRAPDPARSRLGERVGLGPHRLAQRRQERLRVRGQLVRRARRRRRSSTRPTYSWEWDENWEAKTARTPTGWSAEIRIPLRVLRFDSSLPVQSWGFQATRFIAAAPGDRPVGLLSRATSASPVAFFGRLDDLRGLKGAGALELRPFALGRVRRRDAGREHAGGSGFALGGSAGLDLKWHVAQDLTLDAAFNPGLRPGRGRSGDPQPDQLRDLPAREAPVLPGGDRRLLVPALRSSTRAASAARRSRRRCERAPASGESAGRASRSPRRSTAPASWSAASAPTGRSAR